MYTKKYWSRTTGNVGWMLFGVGVHLISSSNHNDLREVLYYMLMSIGFWVLGKYLKGEE